VPSDSPVLRTQDARGVVTLTLNRPKAFNALSEAMLEAMQAEIMNRGAGHEHAPGEEHDSTAVPAAADSAGEHQHMDSAAAAPDTVAAEPTHTHAPGTPAHKD